ncbi:hypothetical protein SK128_015109, partial [Halocaridina rubra]
MSYGNFLHTGDRILEVEGTDLRGATHEKAVEVIKKTGNPVTFVVQSLVQWTPANSAPPSRDVSRLGIHAPHSVTPARTPTPELIQVSRTPPSAPSTASNLSSGLEISLQADKVHPCGTVCSAGLLRESTNSKTSFRNVSVLSKDNDNSEYDIPGSESPVHARDCKSFRSGHPSSSDPLNDSVSQSHPSSRDIILADPPAAFFSASSSSFSSSAMYSSSSFYSIGTSKYGCFTMADASTTTTTSTTVSPIFPITTHTTTTSTTTTFLPLIPSGIYHHTTHTVAAAFMLPPQASTPLSEGSSLQLQQQEEALPTEKRHPPDPRDTFPGGPPIPETSTPIHELYPEPVRFVPESPIAEPEDPDPLVNPYYYYARAALAHWHIRAQRTQSEPIESKGDGYVSDQENSTSSSSGSSTASRRFFSLRSCATNSFIQTSRASETKLDTPPSDGPLMDTPPSDIPTLDNSPQDDLPEANVMGNDIPLPESVERDVYKEPNKSEPKIDSKIINFCETAQIDLQSKSTFIYYCDSVQVDSLPCESIQNNSEDSEPEVSDAQTENVVIKMPLKDVKSECVESITPVIVPTCTSEYIDSVESDRKPRSLPLLSIPVEPSVDDPPVGTYTYDWRTDPHLYQGLWCVQGSVSEHLAAQVPTQPVSPYDSPAFTPTANTPTTEQ